MITSKQRSYLKSLAHNLDPIVHIGKDGLTENIIKEMNICLENRELIKVKLQEGAILEPKETANEAAQILGAEFVQAIGRKFVLYRFSKERAKEGKQIVLPR
ncbi:MAG: ribosome assembly RNA-binding protein YhbY [Clostridiales bacterium]|nr:ribosome assembly RNA-binding protein YhbY [Clostridiales bacterium]